MTIGDQLAFGFANRQMAGITPTTSPGKALRPGTGYCSGVDFVCNPYIGCAHGCTFCVSPETKITTDRLQQISAHELTEGERVFTLEEKPSSRQHGRLTTIGEIEKKWGTVQKHTYRIITENRELTCGNRHPILRNRGRWTQANQLQVGSGIRVMADLDNPVINEDFKLGYLQGLAQGEQTVRFDPQNRRKDQPQIYWRVAVKDLKILGRTQSYLKDLGVHLNIRPFSRETPNHAPLWKLESRAFGTIRAIRQLLETDRESSAYRRGRICGFFDAEGSYEDANLRISQSNERALEYYQGIGRREGIQFELEPDYKGNGNRTLRLLEGISGAISFFAKVQPSVDSHWENLLGKYHGTTIEKVIAKEKVKDQEHIDFQTSCRTFVANGIVTHNCYARAFVPPGPERDNWGNWLKYKEGCLSEIKTALPDLAGKSIFLSSATDPYQPVETKLEITRTILSLLVDSPAGQPELLLITRSPMILRDIPIIARFEKKTVTVSITSDDPVIHRTAEPKTASYEARWKMLETLKKAGIPIGVNLCPLLRVLNPEKMVERLKALNPKHIVIDIPHERTNPHGYVGTTPPEALAGLRRAGWSDDEPPLASVQIKNLLAITP